LGSSGVVAFCRLWSTPATGCSITMRARISAWSARAIG
jgi:hypothetical protein